MKKYLLILFCCLFYFNLSAQSDDDKTWINVAYNNNQYGSVLRIPFEGIASLNSYGATFGVEKYLNSTFNLAISFSVGEVYDSENSQVRASLFGGQVMGKYKFNNGKLMSEESKFAPYIGLGLGIISFSDTFLEEELGTDLVATPELGFEYLLNDRLKLTASAAYKINSSVSYRQFSIGAGFSLKKKADSDGDGISDSKDECPLDFGPKDNAGCPYPDQDGDGVLDSEDKCPTIAGTVNGCPDQDGDGVPDTEDKCPSQAGADGGCPEVVDTDGDGVPDAEDKCPNEAGEFGGCKTDPNAPVKVEEPVKTEEDPVKTDDPVKGDTVISAKPKTTEPALRPARRDEVDPNDIYRLPMEFVAFNPGSDALRPEQKAELDRLAEMMLEDESFKVELIGYGDRNKTPEENFTLARQRVVIIRNYMIRKGVSPYRFISSVRGTPRVTGTAGRVIVRAL